MTPSSPSAPVSGSSLLSSNPAVDALDYDLLQRYSATARTLERMLATRTGPVEVLELGPNFLNPLPLFLEPARVRLTRADVCPVSTDADFVLLPAEGRLPFADDSFDAVIALEVLEHMPAERRREFLGECLRVARHGAILSCPNGVAEVEEAERRANEAYRARHGNEHPWLLEHRQYGLPREADVVAILRELDFPHAVFDNAPVETWLPMLLLCENLSERQAPAELLRRLNELTGTHAGIPYRKIYVVAKSFDATAALEPLPPATTTGAAAPGDALHWIATTSAQALTALEQDRRNERVAEATVRRLVEVELDELRGGVADLETRLRERDDRIAQLGDEVALGAEELRTSLRRHYIVHAYAQALRQSRLQRAAEPLAKVASLVRSRGFDERALIPWNHLEPDAFASPGVWRVTGPRAYFIIPCALPAGWVQVHLHLASDQVGRAEIVFDTGEGHEEAVLVDRVAVHGRADRDGCIFLPRPVIGLRLYPLDVVGKFQLDAFRVTALSSLATLQYAFRRKFDLLTSHGLLKKAVRNALGMLARGQFRELGRKLYGGLTYRRPAPEAIGAPEASVVEPVEEVRKNLGFAPAGTPLALGGKKLDIVYVLRSAGLCGGVKVVFEHASRLYARGHNVRIFHLEGNSSWFPWCVPTQRFANAAALQKTLRNCRGIKVATWYETAPWVADSLRGDDRGYYLVQDIEESYGDTAVQAAAALRTYSLGLRPITEGLWVRQQLQDRFGLDSVFVSIGLDHDRYGPQVVLREPQRILTQQRTWSGGVAAGNRIKGWDLARNIALRCHAANPRTTLTTFSIEGAQPLPPELSRTHHQTPSDARLAELYGQAGIYLLTSRHEGFGLTAAEAMACGCPVVATQAQGNEEFCIDGVTALTAPVDDVETLARHCLRLQTDQALARQLGKAGQDFIRQYTWDRVLDRLEQEFLERDGPEVVIAPPAREAAAEPIAPAVTVPRPTSPSACRRGGEYPDLRLRGSSFVDWSIVIPTIGKPDLVSDCVASCRRFMPEGASVQFIVVDDGSSDAGVMQGLRAAAKEHDFQLLFNRQNLGFSASINRGLRKARGRYVVLCNNDVVFHQPWMEPVEQLFQTDPHVGIIGARLLFPDGTIQHGGMDKAQGSLRWYHKDGKKPGDTPGAGERRYMWAVTGALMAVRRSVLERLGGLSTAYATAYEDLDYCLYAWANGVRVAYAGDVCAYHLEGHTRGASEAQKRQRPLWAERERAGRAYFEKKWAFLRRVDDFRALMSLMDRGAEFPVFANEMEGATA